MTTSVIIVTHNEGPDLEVTVAMAVAATPAPDEIIVIDDLSDTPVAPRLLKFPSVRVHRTTQQIGAGPAKRLGGELASGDLLLILDSHMRMPCEWVGRFIAASEAHPRAIWCCQCRGFDADSKFRGAGATFSRNTKDLVLHRHWMAPGKGLDCCPCLLGACYAIPRSIWLSLGGLNPNLHGWGYGEQDLSIRAWLMGYEVRCISDLIVQHRFKRGLRGNFMNTWHNAYNAMVTAATVFEDGVFESIYEPHLRQVQACRAVDYFDAHRDGILEFRKAFQAVRVVADADLERLCAFKLPTADEMAALAQQSIADKRKAIKPLLGLSHREAILQALPAGGRLLEWGSGGSTHWFRSMLAKDQEIVSIEHNPDWARLIGGVRLLPLDVAGGKPSAEYAPGTSEVYLGDDLPYVRGEGLGQFDVVLVDGVLRNACLLRLRNSDLLKPGATVFLHDAQRDWYEPGKTGIDWDQSWPACPDYRGPTLIAGSLP